MSGGVKRNPKKFNELARKILRSLKNKAPGDRSVQVAINLLGASSQFNGKLPATEFYHTLAEEKNQHILQAIQNDNIDYFFEPGRIKGLPIIGDFDFEKWSDILNDRMRKNLFQSVKELVSYSGHSIEPQTGDEGEKPDYKGPSDEVLEKFNGHYLQFLNDMVGAFPSEHGESLLALCQKTIREAPTRVFLRCKEVILPRLSLLMQCDPVIFQCPDEFVGKLPFVEKLPLTTYWKQSITECEANKQVLWNSIQNMVLIISGMGGIDSSQMDILRDHAVRVTQDIQLSGKTSIDGGDITKIATTVMTQIMGNPDSYSNLLDTVQQGMANFDPDIIEGVMQSIDMEQLGPIMDICTEMMSGSTGAPPFGETVAKPGRLQMDEGKTE